MKLCLLSAHESVAVLDSDEAPEALVVNVHYAESKKVGKALFGRLERIELDEELQDLVFYEEVPFKR